MYSASNYKKKFRSLLFGSAVFSMGLFTYAFISNMADQKPKSISEAAFKSDVEFQFRVEKALMENPSIILEALRKLDQIKKQDDLKADALLIAANMDALHNDGMSWISGNPDGDVTVVEFIDYKCGYCRKAHAEVAELIKQDSNIRLIIKEYPILGEDSLYSSRIAIATLRTLGPDAYEKIYNLLINYGGPVNKDTAAGILNKVGLDAAIVLPALQSKEVEDQIALTSSLGRRLKITGTPAFLFNDQIVRGYIPLASMQSMIEKLRSQVDKDKDKS